MLASVNDTFRKVLGVRGTLSRVPRWLLRPHPRGLGDSFKGPPGVSPLKRRGKCDREPFCAGYRGGRAGEEEVEFNFGFGTGGADDDDVAVFEREGRTLGRRQVGWEEPEMQSVGRAAGSRRSGRRARPQWTRAPGAQGIHQGSHAGRYPALPCRSPRLPRSRSRTWHRGHPARRKASCRGAYSMRSFR